MKLYTWTGKGHHSTARIIVLADCMKSARELIEKALIDAGLYASWEESQEIDEQERNDCRVVYVDYGDY